MLTNRCIPIIIEICIFASILGLIFNYGHLLISLLFLESFILALVILIPTAIAALSANSLYLRVILLSLGACEASLGLALMVIMSRFRGSDILKNINSNKC